MVKQTPKNGVHCSSIITATSKETMAPAGLTAGVSEFEAPFWLLQNVTCSHTEIPKLVTDFTCPIYSTCCVEKES